VGDPDELGRLGFADSKQRDAIFGPASRHFSGPYSARDF
jgi:hypothetical protein